MPRTIVIVKSCQAFRARQDACRATWAGDLARRRVPLWFLEGGHDEVNQPLLSDCWLLLPGGDAYMDNSHKVKAGLGYFLQYDPFDFVFICDDNTYVHPARWVAYAPQGDFVGLEDPPKVPWCHGGAGWYMSRRATELYVRGIQQRCSWDDRLATDILRKHGIKMISRPDLFAQWDERVSADNSLITCHNVEPDEMPVLHEKVMAIEVA